MARCRICKDQALFITEEEQKLRTCDSCRERLAVPPPLPASRRPPGPCTRCQSLVHVRAWARQRAEDAALVPLAVVFARATGRRRNGEVYEKDTLDFADPRGLFEVFVCRGCGLTEWYAVDPEAIPIGPEYGTELVTTNAAPYR